jgi:CRP-like cAMP-binding protein
MLRLISPTAKQHMETIPVMSSLLKNIAKMQIMLADMEAEFGIRDIGAIEKSVLSSVADLAGDARLVSTKDILQHPLNSVYSRPSLFRALKNLESLGKIAKGGKKRGLYTLVG